MRSRARAGRWHRAAAGTAAGALAWTCLLLGAGGGIAAAATPAPPPKPQSEEWWLTGRIDFAALRPTTQGAGVEVAVLGPTLYTKETELSDSLVDGTSFPPASPTTDTYAKTSACYSTQAATLIAGNGNGAATKANPTGSGDGVLGVAPQTQILPISVGMLKGQDLADPGYLAQAVNAAVVQRVKVIDIAIPAPDSPALTSAVDAALKAGIVVVGPTGDNYETHDLASSPADIPGVLGVGAVGKAWAVPTGAQSANIPAVAAPGEEIVTGNYGGNDTTLHYGTGCAAALVSGEAALLISKHPDWTAGQVVTAIVKTATGNGKVLNSQVGYGVINPAAAMASVPPAGSANPLGGPQPAAAASTAPHPVAGKASSSSPLPLILIIVGAVVVLALAVFLFLRLRKPRKRYVLPPPAPYLGAGPTSRLPQEYDPGYSSGGQWAQPAPQPMPEQTPGQQQPGQGQHGPQGQQPQQQLPQQAQQPQQQLPQQAQQAQQPQQQQAQLPPMPFPYSDQQSPAQQQGWAENYGWQQQAQPPQPQQPQQQQPGDNWAPQVPQQLPPGEAYQNPQETGQQPEDPRQQG